MSPHVTAICRMTDDQIKEVFCRVYRDKTLNRDPYLYHLAAAIVSADGRKFELVRPSALLTISEYDLYEPSSV